jgi:hypothetical protein
MLMKPITALLLFTLAGVGTACSDTVGAADEAAPAEVASAPAAEVQGTLNLNLGRSGESQARPIIGSSANTGTGLIVGPSQTGGNFEGVQDLGIDIEDAPHDPLATPEESDEDDLIRIPEKK